MSTKKSWALTPREFDALQRVYQTSVKRWATEQAHQFALHGVKHANGQPWTADDFIETPGSRALKTQQERDEMGLIAAKTAAAVEMTRMRSGTYDESLLPAWARMTDEERAKRTR